MVAGILGSSEKGVCAEYEDTIEGPACVME